MDTEEQQERLIPTLIKQQLTPFSSEIAKRNAYIQERDDVVYGDALMDRINWVNGADKTRYNWLERLVDIHTSQLMGRSFQVYSTYVKQDLSIVQLSNDPQEMQNAEALNKKAKMDADARGKLVRAMIKDNGGDELFQTGAQSGSAFGFTVYKSWMGNPDDKKDAPWHIEMLENLQNYWAIWSGDNFRKRDADVYISQISEMMANGKYSRYLDEGERFVLSTLGTPLGDPNPAAPTQEAGSEPMVTVIEYTGLLPGYKGVETTGQDDSLVACGYGEETPVNIMTVGDCLVRIIANTDKIPRYYLIPNRRIQRRPYGLADVTPTCIDTNVTYIERMSDWATIANKVLFQKYKAKGFDVGSVPALSPRKTEIVPMDAEQDIEAIVSNTTFGNDYLQLISQIKENFVRSAGISQVLFDNPQLSANSNQALMTTMKGMIDTVEKKQKVWQKTLVDMFEDAILTAAKHYPSIKLFVPEDEDWMFTIKWPSIMRADDPQKQTMDINAWHTGAMSVETLLEERGVEDVSQELDRIRDDMKDVVSSAIRGGQMGLLAERNIVPPRTPQDPPLAPAIKHTFNWSLAATPEQAANLAETVPGMQNGSFGESAGPQGRPAAIANSNLMDQGQFTDVPQLGGLPIDQNKQGQEHAATVVNPNNKTGTPTPSPISTPDQNQPGAGIASTPGSGAPTPVSPAGAIAQTNQRNGK